MLLLTVVLSIYTLRRWMNAIAIRLSAAPAPSAPATFAGRIKQLVTSIMRKITAFAAILGVLYFCGMAGIFG